MTEPTNLEYFQFLAIIVSMVFLGFGNFTLGIIALGFSILLGLFK